MLRPCLITPGLLATAVHASPQGRGGGFRQPDPIDFNDHAGFTSLFDGLTLNQWDGDPSVWTVENGAIVGTSPAARAVGTTFLIWRGGESADFELKLEVRVEGWGANTGIQYRSQNITPGFGRGPCPSGAIPARGPASGPPLADPRVHQPRWVSRVIRPTSISPTSSQAS